MSWFVGIPIVTWAGAKVVEVVSDDPEVKKAARKVQEVSKVGLAVLIAFVPPAQKVPIPKNL